MENRSAIFAVISSSRPTLQNAKLFNSVECARKHLKSLADERKNRLGVQCFEFSEDEFSFLFGWEETKVSFYIVELPVED